MERGKEVLPLKTIEKNKEKSFQKQSRSSAVPKCSLQRDIFGSSASDTLGSQNFETDEQKSTGDSSKNSVNITDQVDFHTGPPAMSDRDSRFSSSRPMDLVDEISSSQASRGRKITANSEKNSEFIADQQSKLDFGATSIGNDEMLRTRSTSSNFTDSSAEKLGNDKKKAKTTIEPFHGEIKPYAVTITFGEMKKVLWLANVAQVETLREFIDFNNTRQKKFAEESEELQEQLKKYEEMQEDSSLEDNPDPKLCQLEPIATRLATLVSELSNLVCPPAAGHSYKPADDNSFAQRAKRNIHKSSQQTLPPPNDSLPPPNEPIISSGQSPSMKNFLTFENVLNGQANDRSSLAKLINNTLFSQGLLQEVKQTHITSIVASSVKNAFTVQFCNPNLARDIYLCRRLFNSTQVEKSNKVYISPCLSPTEKMQVKSKLSKFIQLQGSTEVKFKAYASGHNIKIVITDSGNITKSFYNTKSSESPEAFLKKIISVSQL
jgi:hypothetical protein